MLEEDDGAAEDCPVCPEVAGPAAPPDTGSPLLADSPMLEVIVVLPFAEALVDSRSGRRLPASATRSLLSDMACS